MSRQEIIDKFYVANGPCCHPSSYSTPCTCSAGSTPPACLLSA